MSLSGVSYGVATGFIDSREIKNNAIRSLDIRNNEIRTRDLRNNEVRGIDIRNSTVQGRDIALNTVTGEDIKRDTPRQGAERSRAPTPRRAPPAGVTHAADHPATTVPRAADPSRWPSHGPLTLSARLRRRALRGLRLDGRVRLQAATPAESGTASDATFGPRSRRADATVRSATARHRATARGHDGLGRRAERPGLQRRSGAVRATRPTSSCGFHGHLAPQG